MQYKIIPLSEHLAASIRQSLADEYGHKLSPVSLKGRALCRFCLSDGDHTQKHILFSYSPFEENKTPYYEIGPVYIHDQCEQYKAANVLPPDLKTRKYLTVRGYNKEQLLLKGEMSEGHLVEESVNKLLDHPSIDYVHIGDASTGCYFLRVEKI